MPEARKRLCTIGSAVISAGSANRKSATRLGQAGTSEVAASEDTGELAERHTEYGAAYRIQQRALQRDRVTEPPANACASASSSLGLAKDLFGAEGADFIGTASGLLV